MKSEVKMMQPQPAREMSAAEVARQRRLKDRQMRWYRRRSAGYGARIGAEAMPDTEARAWLGRQRRQAARHVARPD